MFRPKKKFGKIETRSDDIQRNMFLQQMKEGSVRRDLIHMPALFTIRVARISFSSFIPVLLYRARFYTYLLKSIVFYRINSISFTDGYDPRKRKKGNWLYSFRITDRSRPTVRIRDCQQRVNKSVEVVQIARQKSAQSWVGVSTHQRSEERGLSR